MRRARRSAARGGPVAAALAALGLAASAPVLATPPDAHHGHERRAPAPDAPDAASSESIYQLESRFTSANGDVVGLSSLAGRVQVIAMVYTHCEHACPRIIADMKELRRVLGEDGAQVGYVLVSLDPTRDTAERLAEFAKKMDLADGWTLLRADEGAVRELAAVLGVRYRRVGEADFVHSNLLTVVDPDGVVVHRQVGLGIDPAASAAAIRAALARR